MNYLKSVAGVRTVPVEVGDTYLDKGYRQELMTLGDFIERISSPGRDASRSECAYLAQHPVFEQIPKLRDDIVTPSYCYLTQCPDGGDDDPAVNGWFGPAGTVTPCHYDPKHNLLCQVVGRKYIRLYPADKTQGDDPAWSPEGSPLYPHTDGMNTNSSRVDLRAPDLGKHTKDP